MLENLIKDGCPGSQQTNAECVQHHPFTPLYHAICQVSGAEGVDGSPKTLCNTLENEGNRIFIFKPVLRVLETQLEKGNF